MYVHSSRTSRLLPTIFRSSQKTDTSMVFGLASWPNKSSCTTLTPSLGRQVSRSVPQSRGALLAMKHTMRADLALPLWGERLAAQPRLETINKGSAPRGCPDWQQQSRHPWERKHQAEKSRHYVEESLHFRFHGRSFHDISVVNV